jgi:hypothetical protein
MSGLAPARRAALALLAGVATFSVAACGSSSSGKTSGTSGAHSTPGSSTGSTPDAKTAAAIRTAYEKFFAPDTPEEVSLGLLQDGQAFKSTVEAQAKGSLAQKSSATVSKIELQSPTVAKVVFSILINGSAALPNQPGFAVKIDGTWKVSGKTFCDLLKLEGSPAPACNTPEATAFPS